MLNPQKLLDAINALNSPPILLTVNNVTLSDPVPYGLSTDIENTKITITAKLSFGYSLGVDVFYHRISLDELGVVEIESGAGITPELIVSSINSTCGTELTAFDLQPITVPIMINSGDARYMTISATNSVVGWIGDVTLLLTRNLPINIDLLYNFMNTTLPSAYSLF